MKSRFRLAAVLAAALLALAPTSASAGTAPYPDPAPVTGDVTVHDPTMIRLADGEYVVYSTHNGLEARTSWDRVHFTRDGSAFPTTPAWWTTYSSGSDPWAPDVSYHDGRYLLYYAVSSFGSNHSAIGLATSRTGLPGTHLDAPGGLDGSALAAAYGILAPPHVILAGKDGKVVNRNAAVAGLEDEVKKLIEAK